MVGVQSVRSMALAVQIYKLQTTYQLTKKAVSLPRYEIQTLPYSHPSRSLVHQLKLNRKRLTNRFQVQERKVLRKTLGSTEKRENTGGGKSRSNCINTPKQYHSCSQEKTSPFLWTYDKEESIRLVDQLLTYWLNRKTKTPWLTEAGNKEKITKNRTSLIKLGSRTSPSQEERHRLNEEEEGKTVR